MRASFAKTSKPWAVAAGLAVTLLFQPLMASAVVFDFDFTTIAGGPGLTAQETAGGVVANGFLYSAATTYADANLWKRNQSHDHGLGICSEGTSLCNSGGGDVNEISNQNNQGNFSNIEVLRLTLPTGKKWTSLWVSSLDDGGSNNNETGTLYWSSSDKPDLSTLSGSSFTFKHSNIGSNDEGNLFSISGFPAGFDPNAKFLFFRAGPNNGGNNDYLVWGGNLSAVPEPSSTALLFVGLAAMGGVAMRGNRSL